MHQTSVRSRASQAFEGQRAFANGIDYHKTCINKAPQRPQVGTITVNTAADATVYEWTINGIVDSITSATSETTATIAAKIAAKINSNPLVRGQVSASAAAAVVTLTSTFPGLAFTASDADANLTTVQSTVAALDADPIPFGRLVSLAGWLSEDPQQNVQECHIAAAALLTAQTKRWTYTYEASLVLKCSIEVDGLSYVFEHVSATDAATSIAALVAKINAGMPADTVLATASTATLILTADVAGIDFKADLYFGTAVGGAGALAVGSPLVSAGPGSSLSFGGVSVRRIDEEQPAAAANAGVEVLVKGSIWVGNNGTSPAAGGDVYVYVGATAADRGKFYASAGTDRLKLPRHIAKWRGLTDETGTLSLLSINAEL